jgi:predicted amidohydrolase YtcJ
MTVIHSGLALDEALTSQSDVTRTMARCAVSGWVEQLSDWINDEMTRPGGDPMVMVQAMAIVFIQTIGSVAAQVSKPSGDQILKEGIIAIIEEQLLRHMEMTRKGAPA